MIYRALTALTTILVAHTASADVIEVQQQGLTFSPQVVTASPGDTIRWIHNGGSHDVVHGIPCNAWDPPIFERMLLNSANPVAEWTVPNAVYGEVGYYCSISDHCERGMVGTINIVPAAGSTVIDVDQQGIRYVPENITVSPGDTVRWTWNNGGHTVTSGDIETCTPDNTYFDLLVDSDHETVLWVVPEDIPNELEYYCIYHCEILHIGRITKASLPGDLNNDGSVDGADLTVLLGCWGNICGDINGDDTTDGSDLSILLGNWTISP